MKTVLRAIRCPQGSFFLLGPRGTGKSTWLRQQFPGAKTIDLLDERERYRLMATPGAFAAELRPLRSGTWVIVDEIQKMPELLDEVHRAIEGQKLKFALCGSSARKLKKAGVNLLAGRAVSREMHPFMPNELGDGFDLEAALRHGTLPIIMAADTAAERDERLAAYVTTYLKEEIQAEAAVRRLPSFVRFLAVAAALHGQSLNTANIARECGVSRPTVEAYLDLLEQTLICRRLRAYEGKLRVKERKHPKLYWVDPGLVRAAQGRLGAAPSPEERGHLFEGLVGATLAAYHSYRNAYNDLSFWSACGSSRDIEVDFLATRGDAMVAIEAKSGGVFQESWCKGLRAFGKPAGILRRIVVCPETPELRTTDGIEVLSYQQFATMLHQGQLFDRAG